MDCPICETTSAQVTNGYGYDVVECPRCGRWKLDGFLSPNAINGLQYVLNKGGNGRRLSSNLSHLIRRNQPPNGGIFQINIDTMETWRLEDPLPKPSQQLDELILLVGDTQPSAAEAAELSADAVSAWIGTAITPKPPNSVLTWLLKQTAAQDLIEQPRGGMSLRLTMPGWDRYFLLKQAKIASRTAFMAMQFGDPELNQIVNDCFRIAVSRAGFTLNVLTDRQGAGSIDDQLRVALRNSRFVLADLSHGNNGAYWEAGFAEGLSRPVIYTCKKSFWDNPSTKPHFDTNHLVTIIWEADKIKEAEDRLVATIRATLPDEAKMNDG
jgi:hypothetical protein